MPVTRLLSGSFEQEQKLAEDGNSIEKKAMLVYAGKFNSLDGEVEIKDEDVDKLAETHNSFLSKLSRLATGDVPAKSYPPIQLDHSTSAKDTVGRLVGNLEVGTHKLEDGTEVKCLLGTVKILGKENVEKVNDGRWTHLSIGADLTSHKISELTITPFPAAAEASLLSRFAGDSTMKALDVLSRKYGGSYQGQSSAGQIFCFYGMQKAEAFMRDANKLPDVQKTEAREDDSSTEGEVFVRVVTRSKLSEGDKMPKYAEMKEQMAKFEKCKKHLMETEKLSEEDADKKLGEMDDESVSKMAAERDEHEKKMADEEAAKKAMSAQLTGPAEGLKRLASQFKDTAVKVELAKKKSMVLTRLAKLRAEAKVTPAELKKLKIDELASKDQKIIDEVLKTYESREATLHLGVFGTVKALSAGQLSSRLKNMRMERLELESRLNMPSKREEALKRLAELDEQEKDVNIHIDNVPQGSHPTEMAGYDEAYDMMKKLMDEGKHDEAKEHMKTYMSSLMKTGMGADVGGDVDKEMSALAEEVKKMQTGFVDFVKLSAPVLGLKTEELV